MARTLLASAISVVALLVAGPVSAQPKKGPTPKGDKTGDKTTGDKAGGDAGTGGDKGTAGDGGTAVDMPEDDTPSTDPTGVNENPDAAKPDAPNEIDANANTAPPKPKITRKDFPIEETLRPITLPALMSEAGLDVRNYIKPYDGNTTLRGRFGITRQIQIGLTYNIGGFFDDADMASTKTKFNTGKSIGLDVTYAVTNFLAVRVTLPFYLSPFAMGATIGVPLKFHIGDRFAFGGGTDFISFKIHNFVPSLVDERMNDANAAFVDSGTKTADGALFFTGFAEWQWKPNLVVGGDFGLLYPDFSDADTPFSLRALVQYSTSNKLDFGGALGFGDIANWRDTVLLNLYAQLRI